MELGGANTFSLKTLVMHFHLVEHVAGLLAV